MSFQKSSINELDSLARGALNERFNEELDKVLANIYDPNTDPKKERSVTLVIKIKPNDRRSQATLTLSAKCALAPAMPVATDLFMQKDYKTGRVIATEVTAEIPGQIGLDGQTTEPKTAQL